MATAYLMYATVHQTNPTLSEKYQDAVALDELVVLSRSSSATRHRA